MADSSAYKDDENANKNSYSAISWHEICSVMSSDVSYVMLATLPVILHSLTDLQQY